MRAWTRRTASGYPDRRAKQIWGSVFEQAPLSDSAKTEKTKKTLVLWDKATCLAEGGEVDEKVVLFRDRCAPEEVRPPMIERSRLSRSRVMKAVACRALHSLSSRR